MNKSHKEKVLEDCQANGLTYSRLMKHEVYSRAEKYPFERFSKLLNNMYYELKEAERRLNEGTKSSLSKV